MGFSEPVHTYVCDISIVTTPLLLELFLITRETASQYELSIWALCIFKTLLLELSMG